MIPERPSSLLNDFDIEGHNEIKFEFDPSTPRMVQPVFMAQKYDQAIKASMASVCKHSQCAITQSSYTALHELPNDDNCLHWGQADPYTSIFNSYGMSYVPNYDLDYQDYYFRMSNEENNIEQFESLHDSIDQNQESAEELDEQPSISSSNDLSAKPAKPKCINKKRSRKIRKRKDLRFRADVLNKTAIRSLKRNFRDNVLAKYPQKRKRSELSKKQQYTSSLDELVSSVSPHLTHNMSENSGIDTHEILREFFGRFINNKLYDTLGDEFTSPKSAEIQDFISKYENCRIKYSHLKYNHLLSQTWMCYLQLTNTWLTST